MEKEEEKWFRSEVKFNVNGKEHKFDVYNNMPETRGLSLLDAVENWSVRVTDGDYSFESLRAYVFKKDSTMRLFSTEEWKDIIMNVSKTED